jgi:hypothetical protein
MLIRQSNAEDQNEESEHSTYADDRPLHDSIVAMAVNGYSRSPMKTPMTIHPAYCLTMSILTPDPRDLGERGLIEAMDRLRDRVSLGGLKFDVPLSECLSWVYSLFQFHQSRLGKVEFRDLNDSIPEGRTLRALEWARTFSAHELASVAQPNLASSGILGMGALGMMMLGAGPGPPIWISDRSLVSERSLEDDRRQLYVDRVAGRQLVEPLEIAKAYLIALPSK